MRIRQILLIHPKRATRGLIKKYIFSELSDTEIVETDSAENALAQLHIHPFNVVIATNQLPDTSIVDLRANLTETSHNAQTPFIIISESESSAERDALIQQGFGHVVQIRVKPSDLIHQINTICDPRAWRKDTRYHIPQAKVTIETQGLETEANLINLSRGGILVELITYQPDLMVKNDLRLALQVPAASGLLNISPLNCKLSRLNVTEWHPDNSPAAMRATFIFVDLEENTTQELEQLLQMAKEDKLIIAADEDESDLSA